MNVPVSSNLESEAEKWGIVLTEDVKAVFKSAKALSEPFNPELVMQSGEFTGRFLSRGDARALFFDRYVPERAVASEVQAPAPQSQLFVIEKDGEIVGGSWVHQSSGTFPGPDGMPLEYRTAFIEDIRLGDVCEADYPQIEEIYDILAVDLENKCYRQVTAGNGHERIYKGESALELAEDGTDNALLTENAEAYPLSRIQEGPWLAPLLPEQIQRADKVIRACYPSGKNDVAMDGPYMGGVLLMHEKYGEIGCALWNDETRRVTEMSVMPVDGKRNLNYFMTLGTAVLDHCKQVGGEWQGTARESTSLRLLKALDRKGSLQLQQGEVDYRLSDGEPMYHVRLTFPAEREAQVDSLWRSRVARPEPGTEKRIL